MNYETLIDCSNQNQNQSRFYIKAAATDMRYFIRNTFSRGLIYKKNFGLM